MASSMSPWSSAAPYRPRPSWAPSATKSSRPLRRVAPCSSSRSDPEFGNRQRRGLGGRDAVWEVEMSTSALRGRHRTGRPHRLDSRSGKVLAWLPAALLLLAPLPGHRVAAQEAHKEYPKPLRLCADPANLPFSSADSKTPG